jgi:hypothetical protein
MTAASTRRDLASARAGPRAARWEGLAEGQDGDDHIVRLPDHGQEVGDEVQGHRRIADEAE